MGDVDMLDMLFDNTTGILSNQSSAKVNSSQTQKGLTGIEEMLFTNPVEDLDEETLKSSGLLLNDDGQTGFESEWSSAFLNSSLNDLDHNEFFNSLMQTNLPDDIKQQQQQERHHQPHSKQFSDHAYSITPSSPNSDSGISNGPYSPANSGSGVEDVSFDIEQELFGPLNLSSYEDAGCDNIPAADPMMMDSLSETSSSPGLLGNESPVNFDFDEFNQNSASSLKGLTISTDETTKTIKVISVNGTHGTSLLSTLSPKQKTGQVTNSPYPELTLSDEEKDLLRKEGISLPTHLPLTREEEKILRSVRRRIRNKASARNSRRKKQDYMEALEKRVKLCTDEKLQLQKKVNDLEKRNSSLMGQLKKLQKLVTDSTRHTARTGTCAMILALSFALVLLPNFQSFMGGNDSSQDSLVAKTASEGSGRPTRSLLSKTDEYTSAGSQQEKTSFNYIPFLNFNNKMAPKASTDEYIHDSIEDVDITQETVTKTASGAVGEKVIHMEITKLPDELASSIKDQKMNSSAGDYKDIQQKDIIRHRSIKMDLDDEL